MLTFPPLSAILPECTVPLPAARLPPSLLLLPRHGLLPRTLRLLLGRLPTLRLLRLRPLLLSPLLPRLLSGLSALRLLRLPLLLLIARLRRLRTSLRTLLLGGWRRTLLWPALLPFRPALFFVLVLWLRVRRDNRPEKQKQGRGTDSWRQSHSNRLR
jgi:hypothetical protein